LFIVKYTLTDNSFQIRGLLKLLYTIFRSTFSEINLVYWRFRVHVCVHSCVRVIIVILVSSLGVETCYQNISEVIICSPNALLAQMAGISNIVAKW